MQVCSTNFAFHTFLNPQEGLIEAVLRDGLRPLSDFPDSERWRQIEAHMPGFFEGLYRQLAEPILHKPYTNSGIFVSPIDFQLLPDSLMYNRARVRIPFSRIDPEYAVLTHELNGHRVALRLTAQNLEETAALWTAALVAEWFAKDQSKMFYYVPQIGVYQPGGIRIEAGDIEQFAPPPPPPAGQ